MRIEEEYKKTGYFWLPEKEDNKVPGVLSIDHDGGIELEIVGHFTDEIDALTRDDDLTRILGHIEKDGLVTLDHCFYTQKNVSFGGISKSKILVNKAFTGAIWGKEESITFNAFSFSVDCLDQWMNTSGVKIDHDYGSNTVTINYTQPETISFPLDNGMNLEIFFAYTIPGYPHLTEAKVTQRAFFKLTSDSLRELSDFTSTAFKINNLMCFAMDELVAIKNVTATSSEIQHDLGEGKTYPAKILYLLSK